MIDLDPATRRTAALIANLSDDQLELPTPCPMYTVGDLLDHIDGLARAFTDAASKKLPEGGTQGPSGDAARLEPGGAPASRSGWPHWPKRGTTRLHGRA